MVQVTTSVTHADATAGAGHVALTAGSHPGEVYQVPTRVIDVGDGTYSATFTPTVAGTHYVAVMVGRQHIAGSPFTLPVRLPDKAPVCAGKCVVTGDGAQGAVAGETATLCIQVHHAHHSAAVVSGGARSCCVSPSPPTVVVGRAGVRPLRAPSHWVWNGLVF